MLFQDVHILSARRLWNLRPELREALLIIIEFSLSSEERKPDATNLILIQLRQLAWIFFRDPIWHLIIQGGNTGSTMEKKHLIEIAIGVRHEYNRKDDGKILAY